MNQSVKFDLINLDIELQRIIDALIPLRQNAKPEEKQLYSYVSKKVDAAGKAVGMALDRIEGR